MKVAKLFHPFKSIFGRFRNSGDTWGTPTSLVLRQAEESAVPGGEDDGSLPTEAVEASAPPGSTVGATIPDLRENLILKECVEEEESVHEASTQIVPARNEVPNQTERRSFTEEGMVTHTKDFLLRTVEGRFVKCADLHGGGRCSVCGGNTDKILFCQVCRRAICFTDAFPWEQGHLCPSHHKRMLFLQDTWAQDKKG
jgi:hypothetical protein